MQFELGHLNTVAAKKAAAARKYLRDVLGDTVVGSIDYLRFPERGIAWGGPFNGQVSRQRLYQALVAKFEPVAIIETGTYLGTTTKFMAALGLPIYSVEGQSRSYGFARARLWRMRNVHLYRDDSRRALRGLFAGQLKGFQNRTLFAYLDAHWNADLPLKEELQIIYDHCPGAIVMIDDFQVPDDPGYRYDDYGPDKVLTATYIKPVLAAYGLETHYPSMKSSDETGAKRGCVVLGSAQVHGATFRELTVLRYGGEEMVASPQHVLP